MSAYAISAPAVPTLAVRRSVNVRPLPTAAGRARRVALARVVVVLAALAVLALFAPRAFAGSETTEAIPFDTYTVAQGESLWSIAAALTGPGEDVHDTISDLQTLNAMGDSSLRAGEQIFIPALDR